MLVFTRMCDIDGCGDNNVQSSSIKSICNLSKRGVQLQHSMHILLYSFRSHFSSLSTANFLKASISTPSSALWFVAFSTT